MFLDATDEELTFRLHGKYPITQAEMTRAAREQHVAVMIELEEL
jgi:hypothetical protein